ncbi:GDSL-type esterase/lipase family protein [Massilia sp. Root418]|uniref:GDSL-type esterase/lipase family protein n=1 Tax=Massilia sp. Root418 TaxID=1736532 RepID=UPI0009EA980F|nr:GDSL-type esterase/lipase family protein [Massilia sp. Root418]
MMAAAFRNRMLRAAALLAALAGPLAQPPAVAQAAAQTAAQAAPKPKPSASEAFQKQDNGTFLELHARFLARAKSGPVGLLFLGDSITAGWQRAPHIWEAYYGKYQPANFGIGGARTQNLIWQIEHGELAGIAPKVTVLMMGTNNSLEYDASEIAAANRKIVSMIRARLPETRILVLGIFPRGPRDPKGGPVTPAAVDEAAKRMATIEAVNRDLATLDDGGMVRFLDIGAVFLGQDGRIPKSIMPDQLHPGPAGYQLWADAMQPLLDSMMKGGFTSREELGALFEAEGEAPFPSPYAGTLTFSALKAKYVSGNGHGYRHELKTVARYRQTVAATREHFSASVTPTLPAGAKTIVAQYHAEGLDTLVKVYVQDTADPGGIDGRADNGVFDVLARLKGTDGKEVTTALGTVRSGERFGLDIRFDGGSAIVAATTATHGAIDTGRTPIKADSGKIYFKFGDYLQARDPATQAHTSSSAKWDEYFRQKGIGSSEVRFNGIQFTRG